MLLCFWVAGVAVLVPLYGGYLWRRATPAAAEASIIAAMFGVVASSLIVSPARIHPTVVGFLLSLGAFIGVTLLTSQPNDANLPPSVAVADLAFGDTQGDRHAEKSGES
jgi:Na+/proline symporter